jgi:cathepsin F
MARHRRLLLLAVAAVLLLHSAAAEGLEDPLIQQVVGADEPGLLSAEAHFASFVQRFGKSYRDADEHAHRLSVFTANLRRARRHQRLDPSAVHGVTKFSDLTPAEFRDHFLGLRRSRGGLLAAGSAHDAPTLPTDGLPDDFDWRDKGAVGPVKDQVRPPPIRSRIRGSPVVFDKG